MNHHQRHLPPGANRALHSLSLLILAVIFPGEMLGMPRHQKIMERPRGYLSTIGAPALRFQAPAPMTAMPAPVEPTNSAIPLVETPSDENTGAIATAPSSPSGEPPTPGNASDASLSSEARPDSKIKTSPQIIPDDTHPPVQPEDFLPFFQFPAPGTPSGNVNVIVPVSPQPPAPSTMAPSSATYRQTSK